ncbi:MAG: AAA family ATPase [Acidobacteriota bacterium]
MIDRWYRANLEKQMRKPFVHVLFGARQTGKTTLLNSLLSHASLRINLADPEERTRLLAEPGLFRKECEALPVLDEPSVVFVDEAQAVPAIFDAVQVLYDRDRTRWRFVLCGSSARKLRKTGANLLPGRSILHRLFPLILPERPPMGHEHLSARSPLIPLESSPKLRSAFPPADLEERLAYGDLPGIVLLDEEDRRQVLRSFVAIHLEEEIRREALVKDWGAFVNFLRLAARESGGIINFAAISRQVGISPPTVKSYYQLLEDMFMGFMVPAFSKSARKSLLSTPRFLFVDLGIQHAACGLTPDPNLVRASPGRYFETWVGIEIWKRLQYAGSGQLHYFRTKDGTEVDYIVELADRTIAIEVKWTDRPSLQDVTGLVMFLRDHPRVREGFVICRCPRPARLSDSIIALPWHLL